METERTILIGDLELGRVLLREWPRWVRLARELILRDGLCTEWVLPRGSPEPAIANEMERQYGFAGEECFFLEWAEDAVRQALDELRNEIEEMRWHERN